MNLKTLDIQIQRTESPRLKDVDLTQLEFGKVFSDHMFVADYINGEWQNMKVMPYGNLSMDPANCMIHYGQSIFEGLKAFKAEDGRILVFRPEMNARRMHASAERMCMAPIPEDMFLEGIRALLEVDKDWIPETEGSSMYLRPFMFATDNFLGVRPSESYRFMIIASPSGPYYRTPVNVKVETHFSRACAGGTGAAKAAGNYAASLYPAKKAREEGYDQLIWTDAKEHDFIEEAGTMNVMFVIDGKLTTSPLTSAILPGVTRMSVLELVRSWGITVEERHIRVSEVIEAAKNGTLTEAFGVGTAATIAQIKSIGLDNDQHLLPDVENRELSKRIFTYMEDLKRGRIDDKFGWNMTV